MRKQDNDKLCYDISDDHAENSQGLKKYPHQGSSKNNYDVNIRQQFSNQKVVDPNAKPSNESFELYNNQNFDICAEIKLNEFCQVSSNNDHACNDDDKFSYPDESGDQTKTASNNFNKKENDVDHGDNSNNNAIIKNQEEVLIREIRMTNKKTLLNNDTNDTKKLGIINLSGQNKNIQLISIFPATPSKDKNSNLSSKIEVSNKNIDLKQNSKNVKNPLTGKNVKNKKLKEKTCNTLTERHNRGLKNQTKLVKNIIVDKKTISYPDCAHIVTCILYESQRKLDVKNQSKESAKRHRDEQNIKRRVYDALNILVSGNIFTFNNKLVGLMENSFLKETQKQNSFGLLIYLNKIKYKRIELIGMIKKYAIVKSIIERNKANPTDVKISMPFSMVHRADEKGGHVKLESTANRKFFTIMSKTNIILSGDMNALLSSRMCSEMSRSSFDKYVNETKVGLKNKLGYVPFFQETKIPM